MSEIRKGDGVDRRGFLRCMAWAGTGVVWTIAGGVPSSKLLGETNDHDGFTFVQISDSHIGFNKPANTDVNATLQVAIDRINALPRTPEFLLHTGDLTHMAKASEFDTLGLLLRGATLQAKSTTSPASTTTPPMTARNTWRVSARARKARAGTASITRVCTSSAW